MESIAQLLEYEFREIYEGEEEEQSTSEQVEATDADEYAMRVAEIKNKVITIFLRA